MCGLPWPTMVAVRFQGSDRSFSGSAWVGRLVPLQVGVSCRTEDDAGPVTTLGVPQQGEGASCVLVT